MAPLTGRYSSLPVLWPKSRTNPLHDRNLIKNSSECAEDIPQAYITKGSSHWRPVYLTKGALAAFLAIFSALAVGIQIMLLLSKRNSGLSEVNDGPHRVLWRYGPTALLTLVASFWTRVETQTKTVAPWIKMTRGFTVARQSLILDYLSQFQLLSITSAIRNKDHTVAAVTFTSVLIKVLLVLSTSLFSLSPTEIVRSNVSLTLKSEFVNNPSGLRANGSLAYANFASMMRFGTSLPHGTSDKYAYQLVESGLLDTPSTISTTLDGFSGGLECEPAALGLPASGSLMNSSHSNFIPIWSTSCGFNITLYDSWDVISMTPDSDHFVGLQSGGCGGSTDIDDKRLAIIIAIMGSPGGYDNKTITNSNSFICKPTYQIQRLHFSAQGSDRFVSASKTADSRVLSNVHPWSIMQAHLDVVPRSPVNTFNTAIISNKTVSFDQYGYLAYLLANTSGNSPEFSTIFEDQEGAKTLITSYYQQYTALLAHASLMQPISSLVEGTATEVESRFLVRDMIANSMTGILAFCIITVGFVSIFDRSSNFFLPENVHSIFGLAICLSPSHILLENLQGIGSTGYPTLRGFLDGWLYRICPANTKGNVGICTKECLASNDELEMREPEHSAFNPASLSSTARIIVALVLIAITATLEATFQISMRKDGLGNVSSKSQYISYLWTTLPTVIFTLISMYCSSADFDTRSLVPFLHLVKGSSFGSSIGLDLINKHPLLLFYGELRSRSFEAMASTSAVTLTSFLTIFSAGLFLGVYADTTVPLQLHVADFVWYNTWGTTSYGYPDYSLATAALVLDSNLTYPSFTYEDLILPNMTVDEGFLMTHPNSSNIEFSGTFPAARPSFANCRLYNSSQVRLDFALMSQDILYAHVLIEPEQCFGNQTGESWNLKVEHVSDDSSPWVGPQVTISSRTPLPPHGYFGIGAAHANLGNARGCSQRLWAWGQWTTEGVNGSLPRVLSVSALGCNESMETVDVSTSLFGRDLAINPKTPPIAKESTTNAVAIYPQSPAGFLEFYTYIPTLFTNMTDRVFDTFFTLLTTSRYAVPVEMIGDGSQAPAVADAIKFHHRIMVAQITAASRYINFYMQKIDMRQSGYEIVPGTNTTSSYNVTGSIPSGRYRVVQDELSTRFLQGLLVAALICCLANWYLIHSAGGCQSIPRKPTTIANVAALLADGDIIDLLQPDIPDSSASKQTRKGLGRLEDCVFRLGWRKLDGHPEQVYSIYVSSTD